MEMLTGINDLFDDDDDEFETEFERLKKLPENQGRSEKEILDLMYEQAQNKLDAALGRDQKQDEDIDYSEMTPEELLAVVENDRKYYSIDDLLLEKEMFDEFEDEYGTENVMIAFWSYRRDGITGSEEMKESLRTYFEENFDDYTEITLDELVEILPEARRQYSPAELQLEREMLGIFSDDYASELIQAAFWYLLQSGTPDENSMNEFLQELTSDLQ